MNENFGKHSSELEIADLIGESVANASKRRQQVMEESLEDLTEEEARKIEGGAKCDLIKPPIITVGIYYPDPFPIGIIIKEPFISL